MSSENRSHPFDQPPRIEALGRIDVARLLAAISPGQPGFLLESGLDVAGTGRWHLAGVDPIGSFEASRDRWQARDSEGQINTGCGDPLEQFDGWWRQWAQEPPAPLAGLPFFGGAVGWIGYEAADRFLGLSARETPAGAIGSLLEGVPDLCWQLYDEVVLVDAITEQGWWIHRGRAGWQDRQWWRLSCRTPLAPIEPISPQRVRIIESSLTDPQYLDAVAAIRQEIGLGEVYEVNLARGWIIDGIPAAQTLHRLWREAQPVPYGAMIQGDPFSLVSASPEQFLSRRGTHLSTRPIKGTIARGCDPQGDREAAAALLADPKERAELAMIVDLERNDLGRICQPGSVQVVHPAQVERYASVMHTVATVTGELRGEPGPGEILRATFPGGSITGAPKLAAMERIRQLEPWPRSIYTGSIGWLAPSGDLELSIAIRSALIRGERALIPFGGAVTWDSKPQAERAEIIDKARAMFDALGITDAY
ncbi:MAG: anthranilate synthase component I family protein [Planctomycetota bacterium]|nr:anthranilate synthase component I family protein [Planctomycetota bacterium]